MSRGAGSAGDPRRRLRRVLPFAVSGALLVFVLARADLAAAWAVLDARALARLGVSLALFSVVSLALEAVCLARVVAASGAKLPGLAAARIKAASYLLGLLNYALGAAAVSVLLRRRAGVPLARSAGMVFLISLVDLVCLLGWAALGASLLDASRPGLRAGLVPAVVAGAVLGFALLRARFSLGPLDALRRLEIFAAARTAESRLLAGLAALRLAFVGSLVALVGAVLWSFGIEVPVSRVLFAGPVLLAVSALPVAVAGLGTAQVAFVALFDAFASADALLAASLALSGGLIVIRSALGLLFAGEFSREALALARQQEDAGERETAP
ncbi:MAG: lysylphosphatidylglycerol synthase domain-containing protein [Myxococcota bacterium]